MQVTPSLYNGGGEIFAFQLSEALANRGHDVCLVSVTEPDPRSPLFERLKTAPFEFISLDKRSGNGVDLRIPFRILGRTLAWKPEVIHTHLRALAYSLFSTPVAGAKFHTVHSLAEKESSSRTRVLYGHLFSLGWNPVAISTAVAESIRQVYKLNPPQVDNGVIELASSPREYFRNEIGATKQDRIICHVGRLTDTKNQLGLLKAFLQLQPLAQDLRLVLVGNDPAIGEPYKRMLQTEIAALAPSLRDRIHLLDVRCDIGNILGASDVFVLCSRYEGLPLSLLEAMSLGMKCVCTRVGGIPDAIDESSGWLVAPDDEAALAAGLIEALESAGNGRGAVARAVFESRFSMEKCAEAYEALYSQQLGVS